MHRQTVRYAVAGILMGLAVGAIALGPVGCADVSVEPKPDPDCPVLTNPGETPPPSFEAYGARLMPIVNTFSDGTISIERGHFWDSEREEPCSLVRIDGDASRCLPAFVWNSKPGWFADSSCSQPVLITDACAELPRYVRDESVAPWNVCQPAALDTLRALGEPIAGDVLYTLDPMNNCVAKDDALGAVNVALPIGAPISLDAFVSVSNVSHGAP
jgi:hypothetical protein